MHHRADRDVSAISRERDGPAEKIRIDVTRKICTHLHPSGGLGIFDTTEGQPRAVVR
jgi:hypothetical protein